MGFAILLLAWFALGPVIPFNGFLLRGFCAFFESVDGWELFCEFFNIRRVLEVTMPWNTLPWKFRVQRGRVLSYGNEFLRYEQQGTLDKKSRRDGTRRQTLILTVIKRYQSVICLCKSGASRFYSGGNTQLMRFIMVETLTLFH